MSLSSTKASSYGQTTEAFTASRPAQAASSTSSQGGSIAASASQSASRYAPAARRQGTTTDSRPAAVKASAAPVNNSSNVSLRFNVDEKTNAVTVYVVDRQSKKVLRTIPASELNKLTPGDLVRLTA